jgi:hypothetical protein
VIQVDENYFSPTTLSADDAAHDGGQAGAPMVPPRPEAAARRSGWTAGRIAALVIGVLLGLISLGLLASGGTALWADRTQRDAGYVTTDVHQFSTSGSALATEPTDFGSAGTGWLYSPSLLDKIRIQVTPATSSSALFVGIGPSADVDRYLAGVSHTLISDFWDEKVQAISGGAPASAPGAQEFWVASATGAGAQSVVWEPTDGSWTVVVMNADGRSGIDVAADLGARLPSLLWIAVGFLVAGAVLAAGAVLLIVGAVRRRQPDKDVVGAT